MCLQCRFAGAACSRLARKEVAASKTLARIVGVTQSRGRLSDSSAIFTRKGPDLSAPGRLCARRT